MRFSFFLLLTISCVVFAATGAQAGEKRIMGRFENALLLPEKFSVRAKLDTGADNSSLSAENIKEFERNGETWVQFSVTNHKNETVIFKRPVVRTAKIKRHAEHRQVRLVVRMGICVGGCYRQVEVNLVDRSNFKCRLLIGTSFMSGKIVVDPEMEYATELKCDGAGKIE